MGVVATGGAREHELMLGGVAQEGGGMGTGVGGCEGVGQSLWVWWPQEVLRSMN